MELVRSFAETLTIPTGLLQGQRFRLHPFQTDWLREALFNEDVRSAYLCCPRKQGKSALIGVVLLAYLFGPLNQENWRAIVASCDRDKADELKRQLEEIKKASDIPDSKLKIFADKAVGVAGSEVTFLSGSGNSGQAAGADLSIIDELGLLEERDRPLVAAMNSATSARDGRLLCISIKGAGPFMAEAEERSRALSSVHYVEYAGTPGAALDDEQNWYQANPGLGTIKSLTGFRAQAEAAMLTPADQNLFRSLMLNERIDPNRETIVTVDQWQECLVKELPPRQGRCVIGWDLGGANSFCSAAILWESGRCEVFSAIGGIPKLSERSASDGHGRQLYVLMQERGELTVYPGVRVTPVGAFLTDVVSRLEGQHIVAVACDRYRQSEARDALEAAKVTWPVEYIGQGRGADGTRFTMAFQRCVLSKTLKAKESLMMSLAISQSMIQTDGNGNPCLLKTNTKARIDALSAVVIASGLYEKHLAKKKKSRRYIGIVGE